MAVASQCLPVANTQAEGLVEVTLSWQGKQSHTRFIGRDWTNGETKLVPEGIFDPLVLDTGPDSLIVWGGYYTVLWGGKEISDADVYAEDVLR